MRRSLVLVLCLLALLPGCPTARGRVPESEKVDLGVELRNHTFTLANGLVVVMHRDSSARSAYVHVAYDVGSKDDPLGRAGLAHLFEHLLFGPTRHGDRDAARVLDEIGADFNASTDRDETRYHEGFAPAELPRILWLEAERMAYAASRVDEATLARERDVVVNEWRERYENEPYGHLVASAYAEAFGRGHPYAHPTIGFPDELARVTLDDVRAFAQANYRPNRATLVVGGAFDPTTTRKLIERYFATIPPGPTPTPRVVAGAVIRRSRTVTIEADVPAPRVLMAWPAPGIDGDGLEELSLGLQIFESSAGWRLILDGKIATEVRAWVDPRVLGSLALIDVRGTPGSDAGALVSGIDWDLDQTVRAAEMREVDRFGDLKTRTMVRRVQALEHLPDRADELVHGVRHHGRPDALQEHLQRLSHVRLADAGGAVRQLLLEAPRLVLIVKPTKGAPRAGRVLR